MCTPHFGENNSYLESNIENNIFRINLNVQKLKNIKAGFQLVPLGNRPSVLSHTV